MFHSKNHLIQWMLDNISDRGIQNLLRKDASIELLGRFNPLPGSSWPGWIVALKSYRTNREKYICIRIDDGFELNWWTIDSAPWENWGGDKSVDRLTQGDNPERYEKLKHETK